MASCRNEKETGNSASGSIDPAGFTLLELIIVIGIVAVISSVSYGMLSGSRNDADAKAGCSQLAAYLNKARTYALSGKTDSDGNRFVGIIAKVSGSQVEICGDANGDGDCGDSGDKAIESYVFNHGVDCGTGTIAYGVPSGDPSPSSASFTCSIAGKSYKVNADRFKAVCGQE